MTYYNIYDYTLFCTSRILAPLEPNITAVLTFPNPLSAADISAVSIQEGLEGIMMPCKTYSGMAVGSVIFGISQPPNDLEYIINRYKCGFNVMPDDIKSALDILYLLADNPKLLIKNTKKPKHVINRIYGCFLTIQYLYIYLFFVFFSQIIKFN